MLMLFFGLSCPSPSYPSARDEKMPFPNAQQTVAVRTNRRQDVALLIETWNAYARGLLRGIRASSVNTGRGPFTSGNNAAANRVCQRLDGS